MNQKLTKILPLHEFVIEHLLNRKTREDGTTVYWRDCIGDNGYIVIWEGEGEYFHTYKNPENWL